MGKWYAATDTFVAVLDDGSDKLVTKGEPFQEGHELVKRNLDPKKGDGSLFRLMDTGEDAPKSDAKDSPKASPVKGSGR
jgi:hypothetical protein